MHRLARSFAAALRKSGFNLFSENFFDTVSFKADNAEALVESARRAGFNVRRISNGVSLAFDETTTEQDLIGLSKIWALNYASRFLAKLTMLQVMELQPQPY